MLVAQNSLGPVCPVPLRVQCDEDGFYVCGRNFLQPAAQQLERVQREGHVWYVLERKVL